MSELAWVAVASSNVESIAYDEAASILWVKFLRTAKPYRYLGVPKPVYLDFINAGSKGVFHHQHIRGKYECPDAKGGR